MATQYANPLAHARVTAERIDQGVDYAGTGTLTALARGVVTEISPGGWGSFGNYLKYKVTDPASPLNGQEIYYAEGVNPVGGLKVGSVLNPGDAVANLIPGWHSGIEIGLAGAGPDSTYARESGGGYTEGHATAAGDAFSLLLGDLGAPQGHIEGVMQTGSSSPAGIRQLLAQKGGLGSVIGAGSPLGVAGNAIGDAAGAVGNAVSSGVDVIGAIAGFVSNPIHALLTIVLVVSGALLVYSGAGKMLGYERPVTSTARTAAKSAGLAGAAVA